MEYTFLRRVRRLQRGREGKEGSVRCSIEFWVVEAFYGDIPFPPALNETVRSVLQYDLVSLLDVDLYAMVDQNHGSKEKV